ncbi:hypothetical protein EXS45_02115 [Candidatus Nomurabacteria bacterium]|nr:hypothetical protein [Candidatus Nomurabacteria bacterium]
MDMAENRSTQRTRHSGVVLNVMRGNLHRVARLTPVAGFVFNLKYMDKNKLILPVSILLGCIILGGFFYASQVSKQNSIEKQQQIELRAKKEQNDAVKLGKAFCASDAEQIAIEEYKDYCTVSNYCTYKEGTFLTAQYDSAYKRCLQSKGIE